MLKYDVTLELGERWFNSQAQEEQFFLRETLKYPNITATDPHAAITQCSNFTLPHQKGWFVVQHYSYAIPSELA